MEKNKNKEAVTVDKSIRGGIPVVAGTRIPVIRVVYLNKKKKFSPSTIALKYYTQVSIDQIYAVLEWFDKNKTRYGMAI